ncbi:hypothetical protein OVA24_12500 [Luteolibacter sp. SL250]|uniref:hypothetical protein n=1 Tax=Luteolibacter sp. SL250 TaxID=2995170 RepID=UPI00226F7DBC|nr:hypothetical protein [Luteolibacter sp. SL250]WAC18058.1 hypothetical protein OVA24_12500 [Luteolibacter sp. SL250]
MGQQSNKIIKRRRRADYLNRKKDQAKLGGISKKSSTVKKAAAPAKKAAAPAKKAAAPAKKAAAKKAPAKKVDDAAVAEVADKTVEAIENIEEGAPAPAEEES